MECLIAQGENAIGCSCQYDQPAIGMTGITIDIGQEIKTFIAANPLPAIGIGAAIVYIIYSILKSK